MRKQIKNIFLCVMAVSSWAGLAQDKKDENKVDPLGTEVVNVVKAYTPTISDAFKVKENPTLDDSITTQKKDVLYKINSVPVASTFTPAKGDAAAVQKEPNETLYDSYVSLGLGNFVNAELDFYTSRALNRDETLDISINHHSTQGGIEEVQLDDKFFDTRLDVSYKKDNRRDLDWGADIGYQNQLYNWYGLYENSYDQATLNGIDESQTYHSAYISANASIEDSYFEKGKVTFRRTWDAFGSSENHFLLQPSFQIPIADEYIQTNVRLDYLGGGFDQGFDDNFEIKHNYLLFGVNPNLQILRDDLTVNLGASLYYAGSFSREFGGINAGSDTDFFVYPKVTASYRLVDEYVIAYAGIEGDLIQNTYYNLVQENTFVSPSLLIVPTDQMYDGYFGLKGKFSTNVGYNIRGSYKAENNKPLFKQNRSLIPTFASEEFQKPSTFGVVYDDVTTLSIFGELNFDINRSFKLKLQGEYFNYDTEVETEPWNLPELTFSVFGDYQIDEHWYAGAHVFYVGERQDEFLSPDNGIDPLVVTSVTLDSFIDINLKAGYRLNEQLSIYAKVNNIASQNYQRWANYPVQGLQAMAGLTYKFDF
ncbi:TonB-dependent receptor [Sungkyunkwania multivorans]|uniref:TonB-dependent receptor n=1 Tax=Sungkyunkwania multivorans TaxID=1173618 RepID=A0ABW3CTU7_9FLAO